MLVVIVAKTKNKNQTKYYGLFNLTINYQNLCMYYGENHIYLLTEIDEYSCKRGMKLNRRTERF